MEHKILDLDTNGEKCRQRIDPSDDTQAAWKQQHCRELDVYSVKIAMGTDHSGFSVRPYAGVLGKTPFPTPTGQRLWSGADPIKATPEYINFGAEGLYRHPKWGLGEARYRYLHTASVTEIQALESHHTRKISGVYFWLTNCCHHNTERELIRMGYNVGGCRSTTRFNETKVKEI